MSEPFGAAPAAPPLGEPEVSPSPPPSGSRPAPTEQGRLARLREVAASDLFPPAGPGRIDPVSILMVLLAFAALVLTSLLRQTGVAVIDTVWAEDGAIFLYRALQTTLPEVLSEGYAGYLNIVPRVGAEIVTLVPLAQAATVLALLGPASRPWGR